MTLGQATCGCQARNVTSPTLPGKNRDHDEDEQEENDGKDDCDHIRNDNHADEDDEDEGLADNEDELQFAMHSRAYCHEAIVSKTLAWVFFCRLFMYRNGTKKLKNLGRRFHDWKLV